MYRFYASPTTLDEALALKAYHGEGARIIAGGTDLLIELDRGQRHAPDGSTLGLIDLTRVPGLADIHERDGKLHLGALVTHNQTLAHPRILADAFLLARACWEVGAPQIRNRATLAGNLITASPSNDTIVPLLALDAKVTLQSTLRGERTLPLRDFIVGFRKVDLAPDELLTRIAFAPLTPQQEGAYIKLGLRRAQAITVNSIAAIITWDETHINRCRRRQSASVRSHPQ
jgi:carbon-monoxide dehydrogenase medium subunit